MNLFPRDYAFQKLISSEIKLTPDNDYKLDDTFSVEWEDVNVNKLSMDVKSKVRTDNSFVKIDKKISFPLANDEFSDYTKPTKYIDINQEIVDKANEIVSGETDMYMAVYKVAEWTKSNIDYDLNSVTEKGVKESSWVYRNKQGVCDEITNLFISFLRSVDIPARFVSGVAYSNTNNDFGPHGWAEVYFPGYGWVPWDVTFGQYGWIDPTHVKLDDNYDPGEPSITYNWRSRDVDVKADPLEIKAKIIGTSGDVDKYVKLDVNPLAERARFGSYMLLEANIENLNGYYVPLTLYLTKAPGLYDEHNFKGMVLKPNENKKVYWILEIPKNLDENYVYTSEIEVVTSFGGSAKSSIKYAKDFDYYNLSWAKGLMEKVEEREQKFFFSNLDFKCSLDKKQYLSNEKAELSCTLNNMGNQALKDMKICVKGRCSELDLGISEKKSVVFNLDLSKNETLTISAENNEMVKYAYVNAVVESVPEIDILSVDLKKIGYREQKDLVFVLFSDNTAYNVKIKVDNLGIITVDEFNGRYNVKVPVKGKNFRRGDIEISMVYYDSSNRVYEYENSYPVEVHDIPAYIRWLNNMENFLGFNIPISGFITYNMTERGF